jgi:hypothetical protein
VTSLSDTPCLQYYDVQTLEYRYISKLPMKKERIWSNVKETTSHLQNKLTKNIHLGVATRSSTKWDCLKPIRFHQYTWGLQHFLTFVQEDIGHIKCYWFKINYLFLSSFYIANIQILKKSIKILFHSGIGMLTSPSKFLTGTIFLHAHLQAVYYNCVKFHLNPMSRLGGVVLTSPSLHTERISEYKLNYLPFQILDSNHSPSCTFAGSVLQLCKVS